MKIPIPTDRKPGYRPDTVRLFFGPNKDRGLHFHCRGALCWPWSGVPGIAIMAGLDIDSDNIWVFEEFKFIDMNDFRDRKTEVVIEKGGYHFILDWFLRYGCREYYLKELDDITRQYWMQIDRLIQKGMLPNNPLDIMRVRLDNENLRREHVRHYLKAGRLWGDKDQLPFVFEHLDLMSKVPDTEELLGVKVMSCLLASFEQQPFEKREPYDYQEIWFEGEA